MRGNEEGDAGQEIGQARVSVLIVVSTCRLDAARAATQSPNKFHSARVFGGNVCRGH